MEIGQAITRPALDTKTSPTIGTPVYAGESTFITPPNLDAKSPVGNGVNTVQFHNGVSTIIDTYTADMTNSSTSLNIKASEEDRSAPDYPEISQDTGLMYSDQK